MKMFNIDTEVIKEKYGLRYCRVDEINKTIYATSKFDEWYIVQRGRKFRLYHKNKRYNNNYHLENKIFNSPLEAMKYISRHDDYLINYKYFPKKLDRLFKKIAIN